MISDYGMTEAGDVCSVRVALLETMQWKGNKLDKGMKKMVTGIYGVSVLEWKLIYSHFVQHSRTMRPSVGFSPAIALDLVRTSPSSPQEYR